MRPWLIVIALLIVAGLTYYYGRHPLASRVRINGHVLSVEVVVTEMDKIRGLSGRDTLPPDHGMLFVYDHKEQYNFWMRGMKIPLDFVWINGREVADVTENVPPPSSAFAAPSIVKPAVPVDKILELSAGSIASLGIKTGDRVDFLDK